MVIVQSRSKRMPSGARYTSTNPKRKAAIGRNPSLTRVSDEKKMKSNRTKGGGEKLRQLEVKEANIFDPKTKKSSIVEITSVVENPANRHFVRRNIITQGTIIETKKGNARVTNRPGQEGTINAVLI